MIFNLSQGFHSIYVTDDNNCLVNVKWGGTWIEKVDSGVVVTLNEWVNIRRNIGALNNDLILIRGSVQIHCLLWKHPPGTIIDNFVMTSVLFPGNYNLVFITQTIATLDKIIHLYLIEPYL